MQTMDDSEGETSEHVGSFSTFNPYQPLSFPDPSGSATVLAHQLESSSLPFLVADEATGNLTPLQQDLSDAGGASENTEEGAHIDIPHSSVNGAEQAKPPRETLLSDSDGDDEIWFEASDQLTAEFAIKVSPPLTPDGVPQEQQKQLQPDAGQPDVGQPDAGQPDVGQPDAGQDDIGRPDVGQPDAEQPDAGLDDKVEDIDTSVDTHRVEVHLAESLVKELRVQQKMTEVCKAETNYVQVCTSAMMKDSESFSKESVKGVSVENGGMRIGLEIDTIEPLELNSETVGMGTGLDEVSVKFTTHDTNAPLTPEEESREKQPQLNQVQKIVDTHDSEVYLAESLVRELRAQQKMVEACKAETSYVQVCTSATMDDEEPTSATATSEPVKHDIQVKLETDGTELGPDEIVIDLESTEHVQNQFEQVDEAQPTVTTQQVEPIPVPLAYQAAEAKVMCDASTNTNTEPIETRAQSTNTLTPEFMTRGSNTNPLPATKEIGCNTMLNCFDVLQRAKEMEELQLLKVEHRIAVNEMNEAKSQKMVAEQLTKIVQSDLVELRQQNLTETTKRLQLENELSNVKVPLSLSLSLTHTHSLTHSQLNVPLLQVEMSHTAAQLKEKEERVQELEESLSGTALLVNPTLTHITYHYVLSKSIATHV